MNAELEKMVNEIAEHLNGELYGNEGLDVLRTDAIETALRSFGERVRRETLRQAADHVEQSINEPTAYEIAAELRRLAEGQ